MLTRQFTLCKVNKCIFICNTCNVKSFFKKLCAGGIGVVVQTQASCLGFFFWDVDISSVFVAGVLHFSFFNVALFGFLWYYGNQYLIVLATRRAFTTKWCREGLPVTINISNYSWVVVSLLILNFSLVPYHKVAWSVCLVHWLSPNN